MRQAAKYIEPAKPRVGTSTRVARASAGEAADQKRNPHWRHLSTHTGGHGGDGPRPIASALPTKVDGTPKIQRLCAECEDELRIGGLPVQAKSVVGAAGDKYEREAEAVAHRVMRMPATSRTDAGVALSVSKAREPILQRKPAAVTAYNFIGMPVQGGINPTMQGRLDDVADELRTRFTAVHSRAPGDDAELRDWAGVFSMAGWRHRPGSTSKHCSGSAVDVNYRNQPYIATRTGSVYGGEAAGAALTSQRRAAVEVYDRAVEFAYGEARADVSARTAATTTTPRESTSSVYRRFRNVHDALRIYLGLAFHTSPDRATRRPLANIATATESQLLAGIPTAERRAEGVAVNNIREYILNHQYDPNASDNTYHWNWEDSFMARDYYFQMLRDYEFVRVPMVVGNPEARPAVTRNPARGFLHMTEEFVVATVDTGNLRWGIADLGDAESGDTHHFDLGHHGGVAPDCN